MEFVRLSLVNCDETVEETLLPAAVVTVDGGVDVVPVFEDREGVLRSRRDGSEIDLVDVVVVVGLEDDPRVAA